MNTVKEAPNKEMHRVWGEIKLLIAARENTPLPQATRTKDYWDGSLLSIGGV